MNPSLEYNSTESANGPFALGKSFSGVQPVMDGFYQAPRRGQKSHLGTKPVSRQTTTEMTDTFYIYSHDGKLLAEYDNEGNGVRDYIYLGSRLIAEYNVQTGKYYYYMNDQINSTRIVTDDTGTIVHSSAHGPYGETQKTWTNTYDPKLKFSGKEREAYSGLDYFGARYYDHNRYRFLSVDPIINKKAALYNPQLWNLYAYCGNNPIKYLDPDGRERRAGRPEDLPEPPGFGDGKGWKFKENPNWDPNGEKEIRPGHWIDPEGNKWGWDPDGDNNHGSEHWDVDPHKPGNKDKFDRREKRRRRFKPDGTEIIDNKNKDTLKKMIIGAGALYIIYRSARLLPSLLPPLWWTLPANTILP